MAAITVDRMIQRLKELSAMSPLAGHTLVVIRGEYDSSRGDFDYEQAIPELTKAVDAQITDSRELFQIATNDMEFENRDEVMPIIILRQRS